MFERFTESARRALFFARFEASQTGSLVIGSEHLLLGLTREPPRVVVALLAPNGKPLKALRQELEAECLFREKVPTSVEIPFSAEAKRALEFTEDEANRQRHSYIGPEHLLLGLMRVEGSVAERILTRHGLRLDLLRIEVERLRDESARAGEPQARSMSDDEMLDLIQRIKELVEKLPDYMSDRQAALEIMAVIHAELSSLAAGLSPPTESQ